MRTISSHKAHSPNYAYKERPELVYCLWGSLKNLYHFEMAGLALNAGRGEMCQNLAIGIYILNTFEI